MYSLVTLLKQNPEFRDGYADVVFANQFLHHPKESCIETEF